MHDNFLRNVIYIGTWQALHQKWMINKEKWRKRTTVLLTTTKIGVKEMVKKKIFWLVIEWPSMTRHREQEYNEGNNLLHWRIGSPT